MDSAPRVLFYHAPNSRSLGTLALLEQLGVDYDLHLLNLQTGTQREPEYLAINPMGKVPAIRHGAAFVSEQPAVMMYLADLYPDIGLAPPIDGADRGAYLRWMVFYGSCFEPAVMDRARGHEPGPSAQSPYGSFEQMLATVTGQIEPGPWLLGQRFSAADVLWGVALQWAVGFGVVPDQPTLRTYFERVAALPAVQRAQEMDAEFAARQAGETEAPV